MRTILPKELCDIDPNYGPLFFLAGPIKGGDNWQVRCAENIQRLVPKVYVAVPCRPDAVPSLLAMHASTKGTRFDRQLDWERHHLALAAKTGCIVFWLPEESKMHPRNDGDPYARDTYGELAEWRGQMMFRDDLRVVVGAEPGFPGLDVIHRNFKQAIRRDFPIHGTLEETVQAAVAKAR